MIYGNLQVIVVIVFMNEIPIAMSNFINAGDVGVVAMILTATLCTASYCKGWLLVSFFGCVVYLNGRSKIWTYIQADDKLMLKNSIQVIIYYVMLYLLGRTWGLRDRETFK